jgi:hypothetical protein
MKAVTGQQTELIWEELKSKIDALITRRINSFHDELVERGQIKTMPNSCGPTEEGPD